MIGKVDGISTEECDDGNTVSGDGCSKYCKLETGFTCVQVLWGIPLELPFYRSVCTPDSPVIPGPNPKQQYYRNAIANEFGFTDYTSLNQ